MSKKDLTILGIFLGSLTMFGVYCGYMLNQFINYGILPIEVFKEFWGIIPFGIAVFLSGRMMGDLK